MLTLRASHLRFASFVAGVAALTCVSAPVHAQQAEDPIPPDVLIMLDTSGSMEDLVDDARQTLLNAPDATRAAALPTCFCGPNDLTCNPPAPGTTIPASKAINRWGTAVQSLTGTVKPYFACARSPRDAGSSFETEFTINGAKPYDSGYFIPHHRIVSTVGGVPCVLGPKTSGTYTPSASWVDSNIISHVLGSRSTPCTFEQNTDGALDRYGQLVRFGLMTFDNDPNPFVGGPTNVASWVVTDLYKGRFSYFNNWLNGAASTSYNVPSLYPATAPATSALWEVGARNWRAPEWEGRLMGFPDPYAIAGDRLNASNRVQRVMAAMRPYGGTPIAGMLQDAYTFLIDETTSEGDFRAPKSDPFKSCRKRYALLITDGGENMDLRGNRNPALPTASGGCETYGEANCPYKRPWDVAASLYAQGVTVVVVGFAVERPTNRQNTAYTCGQLAADQTLFNTTCNSTDAYTQYLYQPCCALQKIAKAGQGYATDARAYFVETPYELDSAIDRILSEISSRAITHTVPVSTGPTVNFTGDTSVLVAGASTYTASLQRLVSRPNTGNLVRKRFDCSVGAEVASDATKGDDFSANMATHTKARTFFTSVPADPYTGFVRPFVDATATGDGLQRQTSTEVGKNAAAILSNVPWTALGQNPTLDQDNTRCGNISNTQRLAPASCAKQVLAYLLGESSSGVSLPDSTFRPFTPRYAGGLDFGAIDHSTPAFVSAPKSLIRDPSYQKFAATWATRKPLIYVETTDGLLHAFDTTVQTKTTNEFWAMLPPAVLPRARELYPPTEVRIIDGAPVAKDVVFQRTSSDVASTDTGWKAWRTMLVAGLGYGGQAGERGYFGVDITDPDPANYIAIGSSLTGADLNARIQADPKGSIGGPHLLWQVGKFPASFGVPPEYEIFGQYSATPAITTVLVDSNGDGIGDKEIGVAILPGGSDFPTPKFQQACARNTQVSAAQPLDTAYKARQNVRCWTKDLVGPDRTTPPLDTKWKPIPGRSVSIVRLDSGEILRTFMRKDGTGTGNDVYTSLRGTSWYSRVTHAELDSPMTGQPVVYPSDVGAIAQKAYIGDADGTLWRLDVTSPNPANWKLELFLDTYAIESTSPQYANSQPIVVQPVVAPMDDGSLMVGVSNGQQESILSTSGVFHYVYALRDDAPTNRAMVNWYQRFTGGERVTGPMAVFDKTFYFATFDPSAAVVTCDDTNSLGYLWGHDYTQPATVGQPSSGGIPKLQDPTTSGLYPKKLSIDRFGGTSTKGKIVPGVALTLAPTCATFSATPDAYGRTMGTETFRSASPYVLKAQVAGATAASKTTQAITVNLATPSRRARVDAWAMVVE